MYTIKNQVIITTNTDLHGESLSKEEIYSLFEQMADPYIMSQEHDIAKPPICKGYNKKFCQLADGKWAITVDVDIYDEEQFKRYQGFSVTFSTSRYTVNPNKKPDIEIRFNPRIFNQNEIVKIADLSTDVVQIDVVELKQKSLEVPVIIFISFATAAVASGFFNKLGGDLYNVVKRQLIQIAERLKRDKKIEPTFNITFQMEYQKNPIQVIISAKLGNMQILEDYNDLSEFLLNHITQVIGNRPLRTISFEIGDRNNKWRIVYFIDKDGNTYTE